LGIFPAGVSNKQNVKPSGFAREIESIMQGREKSKEELNDEDSDFGWSSDVRGEPGLRRQG
jgi:hypothetical protein